MFVDVLGTAVLPLLQVVKNLSFNAVQDKHTELLIMDQNAIPNLYGTQK